jgi:hypothetical protein
MWAGQCMAIYPRRVHAIKKTATSVVYRGWAVTADLMKAIRSAI